MGTRSPFRRHSERYLQKRAQTRAREEYGRPVHAIEQQPAGVRRDPRHQRLVATCPGCGHLYSFDTDRMNRGGMFQIEPDADACPSCGQHPVSVFALSQEAYERRGGGSSARTSHKEIAPPTERPS